MINQFGGAEAPQAFETNRSGVAMALALGCLLLGCTPTVRVEAPKEPIRIDLNITADVRVKVEKAVDDAIVANPDIF